MRTAHKGFWILLATILGSSMAFIDSNVVNVALPRLQVDLAASVANVQWVVEAYALFLGSLLLVGGALGDRFGRKRIFALGILLFALASIACGFAQTIGQLITARAVQGIGGALLTPGSLAIIRASFDESRRGRAIGLWSGFSSITSALGPVIGGWLVQYASWRWVFFINIPLAALVLIIIYLRVPESRNEQATHRLDSAGALLVTLGLGSLVFGLIEANTHGLFDPMIVLYLGIGLLACCAFLYVEYRSPAAMLPLHLFRSRTFAGTNLLTLFLYAALGAALFFLPFNLISVQHYPPTAAGASLLPFTLLMFSLSRWSGGLVTRYGSRLPLVVGPLIVAVGYLLMALPGTEGSYWTTFFPAIVVLGLGMSITVAPLTTTVMGAVEDSYAGAASGVNNAVARVAGLLAIAIFGIVVQSVFDQVLTQQLQHLPLSADLTHLIELERTKLVGIELPHTITPALKQQLEQRIAGSFVSSFRVVMLCSAFLALISSLCAWLTVPGPLRPTATLEEQECGDNACTLSAQQHVH
ncbi:MFS transporter [Tengunoibacter tsumagoiensis]|uniref:MFS transporter n=1 Tax=Tengunoibacter tsumagoiensis TaxID=2014871 RepID=A0A402A3Z2_9CHLR|nr:MFS transporter [Tengunoibacter tsumagoiensis]GCE13802.1 MFS transporter [Tengunoibacter tsumagoiensis]